ncbi:MAG: hypothetical protein COC17_04020 [Hyphomicrobiales bacterium]|nr:L,D-transpeptidase [Hyphomicrobiales bacterium]PCH50748.1 MAG: hypothetical protein COC17_04020 [Hyphomicrobiales bacterium]
MNRRTSLMLMGSAAMALLSGCSESFKDGERKKTFSFTPKGPKEFIKDYRKVNDGGFEIPAVPVKKIEPQFLRQRVSYRTKEKTGTIIVDVKKRFLYLIEPNGKAMRYGVGVGKAGFEWNGNAKVGWKRPWPTWTPPEEMIERKPSLRKYSAENGGMEPGLKNPLGARAIYLFKDGKDTLYRLHGTPQWASIGTAASSGCIRLINQDIIDLYDRVKGRPKVVVKQ